VGIDEDRQGATFDFDHQLAAEVRGRLPASATDVLRPDVEPRRATARRPTNDREGEHVGDRAEALHQRVQIDVSAVTRDEPVQLVGSEEATGEVGELSQHSLLSDMDAHDDLATVPIREVSDR
jgi:hypothetical protein